MQNHRTATGDGSKAYKNLFKKLPPSSDITPHHLNSLILISEPSKNTTLLLCFLSFEISKKRLQMYVFTTSQIHYERRRKNPPVPTCHILIRQGNINDANRTAPSGEEHSLQHAAGRWQAAQCCLHLKLIICNLHKNTPAAVSLFATTQ